MENLTAKLTNKIINKGANNLWNHQLCIGGIFLMSVLEANGFDYRCATWFSSYGTIVINNKLYDVEAKHKNKKIYLMGEKPTLLNYFFPKKITLKFVEIG